MSDVYLIDGNDLKSIADNLRDQLKITFEVSNINSFEENEDVHWYGIHSMAPDSPYLYYFESSISGASATDVIEINSISPTCSHNIDVTSFENKIRVGITTSGYLTSADRYTISGTLYHLGTGSGYKQIPAGVSQAFSPSEKMLSFPEGFMSAIELSATHIPYTIEDFLNGSISTIYDESINYVRSFAFYNNQQIKQVTFENCSVIGEYAFCMCSSLFQINFPNCITINSGAFSTCSLSIISLPKCENIESYAFTTNSALVSLFLPKCKNIGSLAFSQCYKLTDIDLPDCESINMGAFVLCSKLNNINLPNCKIIGERAFSACSGLTEINLPNCEIIGISAFDYCSNITAVSLPKCSVISAAAFSRCYKLISLYLMSSEVVSITTTLVFSSTPLRNFSSYTTSAASIYVPSSLYNDYINHSVWGNLSDKIVGVEV